MKTFAMFPAGRFHSVPAGFARMLARKANALRISSLPLLMRNLGLTHIAHENIRNVPCGPLPLRFQRDLPGCLRARPTHCASVRFPPDAQSGPKIL